MNKKGTVEKIKISYLPNIFIISTAISLGLRVYQFFGGLIDPENGTWADTSFTISLFYIIIVVTSLLMLLFSFLSAESPKSVFPQRKCLKLGAAGLVFSLGLIFDASKQTGRIIDAKEGVMTGLGSFLKESGMLPNLLQIIFAFFAALYMLLFAVSYFKGKNIYIDNKIMALAPMAWAISRLICRFMRATNFRTNSELLLELAMLCLAMIFLFAFSRIASQISHKGKMWMLLGTGLPAAMFSLLCSVPRLSLMIAGRGDLLVNESQLEIADISLAVFAIILIFSIINEYQTGKYEDYDEDNAHFDINKKNETAILTPVDEVIPPSFVNQPPQQASEAEEMPPINIGMPTMNDKDEAFEIASQYSNQYLNTASPYAETEEKTETSQEENHKESDESQSENEEI